MIIVLAFLGPPGWLLAMVLLWRGRGRRRFVREHLYERRRLRDQLAADGWDVLPRTLIGVEGPILRDTAWNQLRREGFGHDPFGPRAGPRPYDQAPESR